MCEDEDGDVGLEVDPLGLLKELGEYVTDAIMTLETASQAIKDYIAHKERGQ